MEGAANARAVAISDSIVRELRNVSRSWAPQGASRSEQAVSDLSLAWGAAGRLAAFAYCAPGRTRAAILEKHADKLSSGLARVPLPSTLFRGFWGIGWAYAHMRTTGIWDALDSDDLDDAIQPSLEWMSDQHAYDLMRGLVGLGVYALESPSKSRARKILRSVVSALGAVCTWSDQGVFWPTSPEALEAAERRTWPRGRTDLGMAHGSAGVIAFLAAVAHRERSQATVRLLEGAVSWLLAQSLGPGRGSLFSAYVDQGTQSSETRLAWCVGDLGISVALALAARSLHREDWREEALRIALHSANRPIGDAVNDTSLCHGSAGIAHLFSRLYQYLGHSTLREAAVRWYERCLAAETPGRFLGFGAPRYAGSRRLDPGFLMGAAGVALALKAATTEHAPSWDRVLLIATT